MLAQEFHKLIGFDVSNSADTSTRLKWDNIEYHGLVKDGLLAGEECRLELVDRRITFLGQFEDNFPSGQGQVHWKDRNYEYQGSLKRSLRNGFGCLRTAEVTFEGLWEDDKLHGKALCTSLIANESYDGEWRSNKRSGYGTAKFSSGSVYEGDWLDGNPDGKGKMTWPSGESYNGDWKNGVPHGSGEYRWPLIFERKFSRYPSSHVYSGHFENGARSGQGTFYYASGAIYTGEWKENYKHGRGIFYGHNGKIYDGEWIWDNPVDKSNPLTLKDQNFEFLVLRQFTLLSDNERYQTDLNRTISFRFETLTKLYAYCAVDLSDNPLNPRKLEHAPTLFTLWEFMSTRFPQIHSYSLAEMERKWSLRYQKNLLCEGYYMNPHDLRIPLLLIDFVDILLLIAVRIKNINFAIATPDDFGRVLSSLLDDLSAALDKERSNSPRCPSKEIEAMLSEYTEICCGIDMRQCPTVRSVAASLKRLSSLSYADILTIIGNTLDIEISVHMENFSDLLQNEVTSYEYVKIRTAIDHRPPSLPIPQIEIID